MTSERRREHRGPYFEAGELVITPRGLLARVMGYGYDGRVDLQYVGDPSQTVCLFADLLELKEGQR